MTAAASGPWFAGRSAVVTGAARGIGRATAELLAGLGAQVVAVDKDADGLRERFGSGNPLPWVGDLAADAAEELAAEIWSRHGPIQLLVNNVGVDTPHRFLELGQDDFDAVFRTNLRGPWFFTKELATRLLETGSSGSIVFVSSLHDSFVRTLPHYSASKAAVAMLVKELAAELAPSVRVNAVSPGRIRTERLADSGGSLVPLGRPGEPLDVAKMVAVLLSDEWSGYVTGTNVRVDGGLSLHSWSTERSADVSRSPFRRLADRLTPKVRRE
ncbi:MAG TPA: SDR family oxidoreductase [Gaiellaceae bacterium]|nr:SDR family oxidoreductase [Gaiellaceae bacterium]